MSRRNRPGVVTVVLVHTADEPVPDATLDALSRTEWPAGGADIVVVDCEPHGIGLRAWAGRDDVDVIRGDEAAPLAAARNRGASVASGEYLAFLAAGAVPDPAWLRVATDVFESDGSVACVAPAVRGRPGPTLSFAGRPTGTRDDVLSNEVLHPHAEAMVVRAQVFRDLGGFVERYERFGEEVELGWRLWLLGFRVRACPDAPVDATGVPAPAVAPERRRFLEDRNALTTLYTHYETANLAAALPAAMALGVRGAAFAGDHHLLASARAVDAFVESLPRLQETRERLQAERRRTDQEIVRLFGSPLQPPVDGRLAAAHRALVESLGLADRFGARRRILVVTADALTRRMAGPAIRAWQISSALASEHEVQLVTTSGLCEVESTAFSVRAVGNDELRELESWCDVLVLQGWILEGRPFLKQSRKVMVVDVYDPMHLEQLEQARDEGDAVRRATVRNATAVLNDQLARGDFFMCASAKQRDFWLGQMSALGRINPLTYDENENLDSLISVVPFGLADEPPVHVADAIKGVVPGIAEDDEVILWGGGIYNWFDPLTLIEAVDRLRRRRPRVRLYFMGLKHPNPEIPEMRMAVAARELAERLGLVGTHVFFNEGWVAYDERQNHLLEADVGVSTHLDHVETAFSFRTRILDYIWATVPIVATAGDAFAELIERETLGLTVPAGDVDALEEALFRVLDDREFAAVCRKNLAAVRPQFAWSNVLRPLVEFCRTPRRAPDLVDPEMAAQLGAGQVVTPTPRGWRQDVRVALRHLRDGGWPLLASKAVSRVRHLLAGRA